MLERVERIARVAGVRYDEENPFARRRRDDGEEKKNSFSNALDEAVARKARPSRDLATPTSEAYNLMLSYPTQSLFYTGQAKLKWTEAMPSGRP